MTPAPSEPPSPRTAPPPDWRTWLVIGATGFGGPAAQIALLHRELVERRRALEEGEFLAAMRICMLLPGPEAQQLATYAGWRQGGIRAGLLAGGLFVLPGALLVTALAWLHALGEKVPLVAAAFEGTRPAVVALVALAAWRIGTRSITTGITAALSLGALAALAAGAPFPLAMLVAGLVGVLAPVPLALPSGRSSAHPVGAVVAGPAPAKPAPKGDAPPSTRAGSVRHPMAVLAVALALWLASYAVVGALPLAPDRGREIARLFTETTLLSFGGAYAVVPWALDASVARGWIEPADRFDALAMGEATPGPLILVVTFLGFFAGFSAPTHSATLAGLCGAGIATHFAFLPSFAMILAVAPLVGAITTSSRLGNALAAVGGVIVAGIVLLGLRLAVMAFVPDGRLDPVALLVAIAAAAALVRGRLSAPVVVALAAGVGIVRMLLG